MVLLQAQVQAERSKQDALSSVGRLVAFQAASAHQWLAGQLVSHMVGHDKAVSCSRLCQDVFSTLQLQVLQLWHPDVCASSSQQALASCCVRHNSGAHACGLHHVLREDLFWLSCPLMLAGWLCQ